VTGKAKSFRGKIWSGLVPKAAPPIFAIRCPFLFGKMDAAGARTQSAASEESGRPFRVAYMTAHALAQRAAICADLAIAPLPRYMTRPDMVILSEKDGLPNLGSYDIRMLVSPRTSPVIEAVANSIRWAFDDMEMAA